MNKITFSLLFCFISSLLIGQDTALNTSSDTTIYAVVEEMPRFPGCEHLDTTITIKNQCAQQSLLGFIYQNIRYPLEAQQNDIEGTVVVTFVVEKDGKVSSAKVARDIGGGCGEEVLRIINGMNEVNLVWTPGKQKGEPVRTKFNLPVKFKLEEAPPYVMMGIDTVYTVFDTPLDFEGGIEGLEKHLNEQLDYPQIGNDSCSIGHIDMSVLVEPSGLVRILDLNDHNSLGIDFQFEAIEAMTSTMGKWKPATYEGRKVSTSYDHRHAFIPTNTEKCQQVIDNFSKANQLMLEGAELYNNEQQEEGIAKMTEAVTLFPENADFLSIRGQAYLNMNKLTEACEDLSKVRAILMVIWYDNLLPVICKG